MLRAPLLGLSRSAGVRRLVEGAPLSRSVVSRYVAGATADDAVRATRVLTDSGLLVTLDHLGEDTLDAQQADAAREAYVVLLRALDEEGLTGRAEVSVKLSAIGQALPGDGERVALDNARAICAAAAATGTTVTLDMEDHTTTDSTLSVLGELRREYPSTGAVIQAYLRRSVADCRDLASEGSRVRLCKGAYDEPEAVAYRDPHDIDTAYVRCLRVLMAGPGYPMVATHDPTLIEIAGALAVREGRRPDSYEFQMLNGVRPDEQRRLVAKGEKVRVYLPYGQEWYGYLVRRMAEKPANLGLFVRSLVSHG
ncbi:MAG TPA: proline dehydrogenase family protein [Actinomycetes bacterium]|nr:proline dehydrogenase family protein [Actinomycetes bacterium]